jgi:hypothetical protein
LSGAADRAALTSAVGRRDPPGTIGPVISHSRLAAMPGNPFTDPNWAPDLADTIDRYVGKVRTTVTERAVTAVRTVVYGIVIAIAAPIVLALLLILMTKLLQRLVGIFVDHNSAIWVSYVVIGALLVGLGLLTMSKRFGDDPA